MANQEHLDILYQGVEIWNRWRKEHPKVRPELSRVSLGDYESGANLSNFDLSEADLSNAYFIRADFTGANLTYATLSYAILSHSFFIRANLSRATLKGTNLIRTDLTGANLTKANFSGADLSGANLSGANLSEARLDKVDLSGANLSEARLDKVDLSGADLRRAKLRRAFLYGADLSSSDLTKANFSGADLSGANLSRTDLIGTNFTKAILTDCKIYGISVWDVQLKGGEQKDLVITSPDQPIITVDNLKIAQFIYLLLNNAEIREVIDTITTKVILILGRFTNERMKVLDALRDELRKRNYAPVLFDFEKPASRDLTETVSTLAHMARFVIADITDAKSIPQELMLIVPNLPSVAVQPLILNSQHEYGMFEHFIRFPWVLPVYRYTDEVSLLASINEKVIVPAEEKAQKLAKR